MERGLGIVLSHDPGGREAQLIAAMRRDANDFGIPLTRRCAYRGVGAFDALLDLGEGMLSVARVVTVVEEFCDLRVVERAAEPGGSPEKKRHQHKQQREAEYGIQPGTFAS
jgi:hypothetical protein